MCFADVSQQVRPNSCVMSNAQSHVLDSPTDHVLEHGPGFREPRLPPPILDEALAIVVHVDHDRDLSGVLVVREGRVEAPRCEGVRDVVRWIRRVHPDHRLDVVRGGPEEAEAGVDDELTLGEEDVKGS